ncbi:MAG: hypothetical protein ABFC90_10060 [Bacteroidales bacterium]|nr:hypothetical protein [Bacteroidales bacterium]
MNFNFPIGSVSISIEKSIEHPIAPIYSTPRIQVNETDFAMTIDGVATYRVKDGQKIWVSPHPGADRASIQLFLNGSVFGALLHQQGSIPFHGCSFEYEGKGIIICGNSGVGKSSVTAAFCQKGARFINDDITPVCLEKDGAKIVPINTKIKLWDDSLKTLEIGDKDLEKIRPEMQKFYVPFGGTNQHPVPLNTVIILSTHEDNKYKAEKLTGIEKYNLLRKNIYRKMYLRGMPLTAGRLFKNLLGIAEKIEVILVKRPHKSDIYSTMDFIQKQL